MFVIVVSNWHRTYKNRKKITGNDIAMLFLKFVGNHILLASSDCGY